MKIDKAEVRKCLGCLKYPRISRTEIDGPGGPIPTGFQLWCSHCNLTLEHKTYNKLIKKWNKITGVI